MLVFPPPVQYFSFSYSFRGKKDQLQPNMLANPGSATDLTNNICTSQRLWMKQSTVPTMKIFHFSEFHLVTFSIILNSHDIRLNLKLENLDNSKLQFRQKRPLVAIFDQLSCYWPSWYQSLQYSIGNSYHPRWLTVRLMCGLVFVGSLYFEWQQFL